MYSVKLYVEKHNVTKNYLILTTEVYDQAVGKNCLNRKVDGAYSSFYEAQESCDNDIDCGGFHASCDESIYYLCDRPAYQTESDCFKILYMKTGKINSYVTRNYFHLKYGIALNI